MKPDFEEKQYETAANGELFRENRHVYAAGQVAERLLGFDVATLQTDDSVVWELLQHGAPSGLQLVPNLWPPGSRPGPDVRLPSYVVSLILQYKRSHYLTKSHANQYRHWNRNYYRFEILEHQQRQLQALESSAGTFAVIRYAAPVFYQYHELESYQLTGAVLRETNFVSPARLAGHHVWTYTQPGINGYANPKGEGVPAESWDDLAEHLGAAREVTTVLEHLRSLASTVEPVRGLFEFDRRELRIDFIEDAELRQGVLDLFTVGRILGRCSTSWWFHVVPAG